MTLLHVKADLFDPNAAGGVKIAAIGHGCNLLGPMGAGVAKLVAKRHPQILEPWRKALRAGEVQLGECWLYDPADGRPLIAQLATQHRLGADARYEAVMAAVDELLNVGDERGWEAVAIPRIGCGIGGLDWAQVLPGLTDIAANHSTTLVVCDPDL